MIIDQWFRDAGHAPRAGMELGGVEAIKEMVAAGLGCSILPAMAVTGPGQHPELPSTCCTCGPKERWRWSCVVTSRSTRPCAR